MMNIQNSVIFKMHVIDTAPDTYEQYLNASRGNLITAVAIEDGTFGLYASHQPEDLTKNYLFEVFNDENAYQEHIQSAQYQQFKQEMADVVVNYHDIDLAPQFMGHQDVALNISTPNDLWINIVQITVKPGHLSDYRQAVAAQLASALKVDPGILATYAGTEQDDPNKWIIYEVFQSEDNYRKHIANPDHASYVEKVKPWIVEKHVNQTIGDVLVNQGNN